jgi:hypothetical protein
VITPGGDGDGDVKTTISTGDPDAGEKCQAKKIKL